MKAKKYMRRAAVFFLLPVLVVAAVGGGPAWASDPEVNFRWAFVAMVSEDGKLGLQPITQDVALKSGDQLKIMVEMQRRCFVYVFHYNAQDGLKLIFPYTLQQFERDYQPNRRYYAPRGEGWFKLDPTPGQEVFYLLGSARRLESVEKAFMAYESAEPALKPEVARAFLDLIKALRRENRELASPAERPVPIGGALRGIQKIEDPAQLDIAAFADEVLSGGFVARTYTIDHR